MAGAPRESSASTSRVTIAASSTYSRGASHGVGAAVRALPVLVEWPGGNYSVVASLAECWSAGSSVPSKHRRQVSSGGGCQWRALLHPTPAGPVNHTVTVVARSRVTAESRRQLDHVVFGDVWLCSGQSNMWLPLDFTFGRRQAVAAARQGVYDNIRVMCGDSGFSKVQAALPWLTASQCATHNSSERHNGNGSALASFCGTCWYFAQEITDAFRRANLKPPVLGLACASAVGAQIEGWLPTDGRCACLPPQRCDL